MRAPRPVRPTRANAFSVSRVTSRALDFDLQLRIDINTEIYPMQQEERFTFCLAHSLAEGAAGDRKEVWRDVGTKKTLADDFDYVMHGKVYKYTDVEGEQGSQMWVVSSGRPASSV